MSTAQGRPVMQRDDLGVIYDEIYRPERLWWVHDDGDFTWKLYATYDHTAKPQLRGVFSDEFASSLSPIKIMDAIRRYGSFPALLLFAQPDEFLEILSAEILRFLL